jgi:hypothetical protein
VKIFTIAPRANMTFCQHLKTGLIFQETALFTYVNNAVDQMHMPEICAIRQKLPHFISSELKKVLSLNLK